MGDHHGYTGPSFQATNPLAGTSYAGSKLPRIFDGHGSLIFIPILLDVALFKVVHTSFKVAFESYTSQGVGEDFLEREYRDHRTNIPTYLLRRK